jgi:hypothetical protein
MFDDSIKLYYVSIPFHVTAMAIIQYIMLAGHHNIYPLGANGFVLQVNHDPVYSLPSKYTICGKFSHQLPPTKEHALEAIFQALRVGHENMVQLMLDDGRERMNWKQLIHNHPLACLYLPVAMTHFLSIRVDFVRGMLQELTVAFSAFSPCGFN